MNFWQNAFLNSIPPPSQRGLPLPPLHHPRGVWGAKGFRQARGNVLSKCFFHFICLIFWKYVKHPRLSLIAFRYWRQIRGARFVAPDSWRTIQGITSSLLSFPVPFSPVNTPNSLGMEPASVEYSVSLSTNSSPLLRNPRAPRGGSPEALRSGLGFQSAPAKPESPPWGISGSFTERVRLAGLPPWVAAER